MSNIILANSGAQPITVAAAGRAAFYSDAPYQVFQVISYPDGGTTESLLFQGRGAYTTGTFASGATLLAQATGLYAGDVLYWSVGAGAVITERLAFAQAAPGALNATGTLTAALILGGTVTSTTAAAVTATLDTGAIMDAANSFAINDVFYWSAINTGGTNAFTVTAAASGHTVVGAGAVAANSSGRFMTRKTAAATFVTYRI